MVPLFAFYFPLFLSNRVDGTFISPLFRTFIPQGDCESRRVRFSELHGTCQAGTDLVRQQMAKVLPSFEPGLFSGWR